MFFGKECRQNQKGKIMRKRNYKGRCIKKSVSKSKEVCKLYDEIQCAYLTVMQDNPNVAEIICNVPLDGEELGEYTTDFLCVLTNGERIVRECGYRKLLTKPKTADLLDKSRNYWLRRGITDWGIVVDAEK